MKLFKNVYLYIELCICLNNNYLKTHTHSTHTYIHTQHTHIQIEPSGFTNDLQIEAANQQLPLPLPSYALPRPPATPSNAAVAPRLVDKFVTKLLHS